MIPGATPSRTVHGRAVGQVLVTSRHLLVAQAVEAALARREVRSRAVPWTLELHPDDAVEVAGRAPVLLVLDDLESREALRQLAAVVRRSPFRVLLLTGCPTGPTWGGALVAGVAEIVHSNTTLDDLEALLDKVALEEAVLPAHTRAELVEQWESWLEEEGVLRRRAARLTAREQTVLAMLAQGRRVADIGAALEVSEATVRSQVKSLRRKLGVDSQLGAVAVARRLGGGMPSSDIVVPSPRPGEQ